MHIEKKFQVIFKVTKSLFNRSKYDRMLNGTSNKTVDKAYSKIFNRIFNKTFNKTFNNTYSKMSICRRFPEGLKRLRMTPKSGETLVEVVMSMVIFIIMLGMLTAAVNYSNASLTKNNEIRQQNNEILSQLTQTDSSLEEKAQIQFIATNSAMDTKGNPVFVVPVTLASKTVTYKDNEANTHDVIFHLYQVDDQTGGGSGDSGSGDSGSGGDTP